MIAAYAANEQTIGRSIIEEVADNLDMLPDKDRLLASDQEIQAVGSARVLTSSGRKEILGDYNIINQEPNIDNIQADVTDVNGNDN
jgi:hypothetical protein